MATLPGSTITTATGYFITLRMLLQANVKNIVVRDILRLALSCAMDALLPIVSSRAGDWILRAIIKFAA